MGNLNSRSAIALGLFLPFWLIRLGLCQPPGQMNSFCRARANGSVKSCLSPAVLKGIKLDPKNPFRFHFFVDTGDDVSLRGSVFGDEAISKRTIQQTD